MAATNGSIQDQYKGAAEEYPATSGATDANGENANGNADLSKDEIGWYFVEQYYTTLSRSPEKLHLFYSKQSQFVFGPEAEPTHVSVGRSAIQERLKSLSFQDTKVRVSNVDSQGSHKNIVIQVIGETSNKSAELKKFVQTFVLAQQPTGYYVLNDIFRYIKDEAEEEPEAAAGQSEATQSHEPLTEDVEMPKAQAVEESKAVELDTTVLDQKLEETLEAPAAKTAELNGTAATEVPEVKVDETPVAAVATPLTVDAVEKQAEEETIQEPEKPKEPLPTPAISRLPSATKTPTVQPTGPPKPMSWANRAAAAATAAAPRPVVPAVPVAKASTSPAPTATRAAPAPAAAAPTPAPKAVPASESNKENDATQSAGWQTAGENAKRLNRPQSVSGPLEKDGTMGYVRNVTEGVKTEELRSALEAYGKLSYFDINRQKNCAFVEFETQAGYNAAFAANPHQLGGESIQVEPRRPKSSAYGGNSYNQNGRGGLNGRGRGGYEQRGGSNQRGRGDFNNRGRGAPRGRGASTTATA